MQLAIITTDVIEWVLLYHNMIILYKASSDWSRKSRDGEPGE